MTRNDDFIGQLEDYLDVHEGQTPLPDAIRDAIRAELPKTKQVGPLVGLARFPTMSNPFKIGIAAAVIGLAAIIGLTYYNTQVGPSPTATPSSSPSPGAGSDLPDELRYAFLGPAKSIPGLPEVQGAILNFTGPSFVYDAGRGLMQATASLAGPGQLRLVSIRSGSSGCELDDEGVYHYSLSAGGTVLTLDEGTDDCAARAIALPGDWQRSNCRNPDNACLGNLQAGTHSSYFFEPRLDGPWEARFGAFTYTVPEGWAAVSDWPDTYGLTTQAVYDTIQGDDCVDCSGDLDTLTILSDPGAANPDCAETNVEGVGSSAEELVAWMSGHPGLVVSAHHSMTVGGFPSIGIFVEPATDWTGTCDEENPFVAVPVFYHDGGYHWALKAGDRWQVYLVDIGDGHTVAVITDSAPGNLDALYEETLPIIDTFDFPPR